MPQTAFYSWQSDTPTSNGRNFLRSVLEKACDNIASSTAVNDAMRDIQVDSDTQGVAGQPPIVETIFNKIDNSTVFVADMTFVGTRTDGRPTPNPNVLIEYGWALKSLTHQRVLCIMNTAHGAPTRDNLPFDISHLKWPIQYSLTEDATPAEKKREKERLIPIIESALRASIATIPAPNPEVQVSPEFRGVEAKDGPARFREDGEKIGIEDGIFNENDKDVFLSGGPAMWLRLMPVNDTGRLWPLHELKEVLLRDGNTNNLTPLIGGAGGYSFVKAEDGIGFFKAIPHPENQAHIEIKSVAFVFETGEIWSIDTSVLSYQNKNLPFIESYYADRIQGYKNFLLALGIEGPYKWIAGMTGVNGRHFNYPVQEGYGRVGAGPRCLTDTIEAEGQYDGEESATTALLPFFQKIFIKCALARPDYLPQE